MIEEELSYQEIKKACEVENSQLYLDKRKYMLYFALLNRWLYAKIQGVSISDYLKKLGYQKVAIYGMAELGNRLYEELLKSEINVLYVLDKNPLSVAIRDEILTLMPSSSTFPEVDVIVVTPILSYHEIYQELRNKMKCPIISLEDLIYDL